MNMESIFDRRILLLLLGLISSSLIEPDMNSFDIVVPAITIINRQITTFIIFICEVRYSLADFDSFPDMGMFFSNEYFTALIALFAAFTEGSTERT